MLDVAVAFRCNLISILRVPCDHLEVGRPYSHSGQLGQATLFLNSRSMARSQATLYRLGDQIMVRTYNTRNPVMLSGNPLFEGDYRLPPGASLKLGGDFDLLVGPWTEPPSASVYPLVSYGPETSPPGDDEVVAWIWEDTHDHDRGRCSAKLTWTAWRPPLELP
jgi:hypothetical protein